MRPPARDEKKKFCRRRMEDDTDSQQEKTHQEDRNRAAGQASAPKVGQTDAMARSRRSDSGDGRVRLSPRAVALCRQLSEDIG